MSPTQDSGPQAQLTNFPHEKSYPSQAQKLVMESVALLFFSVTGSLCDPVLYNQTFTGI